ncbi:MAG: hypothetical protein P9L99_06240 [Candidatus Lernaella stagnicola]|nr:hypothetical protein [Candidatus Lernaella stagnicola]
MHRIALLAILLLLTAGLACGGGGGSNENGRVDDDDDTADDDTGGDDDNDSETCPNIYCVQEETDLDAPWECEGNAGDCYEDFYDFLDLAGAYGDAIPEAELDAQIDAIRNDEVPLFEGALTAAELSDTLVTGLNFAFLHDGLYQRLLTVTKIAEYDENGYTELNFLFDDPLTGTTLGVFLLPDGPGPHPAIVAVHGHEGDARDFIENFGGVYYAQHGIAVLALTMRVLSGVPWEPTIARELLLGGFTLPAYRMAENLNAYRYLQYREDIDNDSIGLMSHSGGNCSNNLLIRVASGFQAYVSDFTCTYGDIDGGGNLASSFVPTIFPYHELVNDFETAALPVFVGPYGYEGLEEDILAFFTEHLL